MFLYSTWDQIWDRASHYYGSDLLDDDNYDHWEALETVASIEFLLNNHV